MSECPIWFLFPPLYLRVSWRKIMVVHIPRIWIFMLLQGCISTTFILVCKNVFKNNTFLIYSFLRHVLLSISLEFDNLGNVLDLMLLEQTWVFASRGQKSVQNCQTCKETPLYYRILAAVPLPPSSNLRRMFFPDKTRFFYWFCDLKR